MYGANGLSRSSDYFWKWTSRHPPQFPNPPVVGWESVCLWFNGFLVLWFYGLWFYSLMVLWFYGFMLLWIYGFLVSKLYQISISCFQEDFDPMSMIFKIALDGSSGIFGTRLFQTCQNVGFSRLWGLQK